MLRSRLFGSREAFLTSFLLYFTLFFLLRHYNTKLCLTRHNGKRKILRYTLQLLAAVLVSVTKTLGPVVISIHCTGAQSQFDIRDTSLQLKREDEQRSQLHVDNPRPRPSKCVARQANHWTTEAHMYGCQC